MICMGGGRGVWLSSSGSSSPPLCPDSSFLNFCRNKHTATLSFVFVFILWTCFVCCVFLYHLCIASQGCGQLLPVVPPSGSDWRFLLSVCLSLTQPPHGTGQPALQQTHNYPYCEYIYYSTAICKFEVLVREYLIFYCSTIRTISFYFQGVSGSRDAAFWSWRADRAAWSPAHSIDCGGDGTWKRKPRRRHRRQY